MTLRETLAALRLDVGRWVAGETCPRKRNLLAALDYQLARTEHHADELLSAFRALDEEEQGCRRVSTTNGTCATG